MKDGRRSCQQQEEEEEEALTEKKLTFRGTEKINFTHIFFFPFRKVHGLFYTKSIDRNDFLN